MLEMCRCLTLDSDIFVLSHTVLEREHSILNRFFNSFLPSWYNLYWLKSKEFLTKATHCPLQPVISIFVLLALLGWVLEYLWYQYIYFSDFHFLLSSNNNTGQIIVLILAQEPDNSAEIEFLSQKTAPQCNSLTDKKKKKCGLEYQLLRSGTYQHLGPYTNILEVEFTEMCAISCTCSPCERSFPRHQDFPEGSPGR